MSCTAKHTKYQPTAEDWRCPKCGATDGKFCIDDGPNMDCEAFHEDDLCVCYACGHEVGGKAFAARIQKAKSLVPCPHCKGVGLVTKEEP